MANGLMGGNNPFSNATPGQSGDNSGVPGVTQTNGKGESVPQIDPTQAIQYFAQASATENQYIEKGNAQYQSALQTAASQIQVGYNLANAELQPAAAAGYKALSLFQQMMGIDPQPVVSGQSILQLDPTLTSLAAQVNSANALQDSTQRAAALGNIQTALESTGASLVSTANAAIASMGARPTSGSIVANMIETGLAMGQSTPDALRVLSGSNLQGAWGGGNLDGSGGSTQAIAGTNIPGGPNTGPYQGMSSSGPYGTFNYPTLTQFEQQWGQQQSNAKFDNGAMMAAYNAQVPYQAQQAMAANNSYAIAEAARNAGAGLQLSTGYMGNTSAQNSNSYGANIAGVLQNAGAAWDATNAANQATLAKANQEQAQLNNLASQWAASYNPVSGKGYTPDQVNSVLQNYPGFQFQLNQGDQQILRNQAAIGNLGTGQTQVALTNYGQGLAQNTYGTYMNQLSGLINLGQSAQNQVAANDVNEYGYLSNLSHLSGQNNQNAQQLMGQVSYNSDVLQGQTTYNAAALNTQMQMQAFLANMNQQTAAMNSSMNVAGQLGSQASNQASQDISGAGFFNGYQSSGGGGGGGGSSSNFTPVYSNGGQTYTMGGLQYNNYGAVI